MTTSRTITKNGAEKLAKVSRGDLAYASGRSRHQAHNLLVQVVRGCGRTQKEISAITGIDEATISRSLRRPKNLELDTISKLVYAACGAFLTYDLVYPRTGMHQSIELAFEVEDKKISADKMFTYWSVDTGSQNPVLTTIPTSSIGNQQPLELDTFGVRGGEVAHA